MSISKTITIAGKSNSPLTVNRLGYGTMRLTGEGIYGEPPNRPEALQILKQAIKSGINFIDTADYYGEDVTNRLIAEAIYPYPADLVICLTTDCHYQLLQKIWAPGRAIRSYCTGLSHRAGIRCYPWRKKRWCCLLCPCWSCLQQARAILFYCKLPLNKLLSLAQICCV